MDRKITKQEENKFLKNGFKKWSDTYYAKTIDGEKYEMDISLNISEDEWYMLYEMRSSINKQCAAFFYAPTLNDIFKIIARENKWIEDGCR